MQVIHQHVNVSSSRQHGRQRSHNKSLNPSHLDIRERREERVRERERDHFTILPRLHVHLAHRPWEFFLIFNFNF